jgi:hypothetical protein
MANMLRISRKAAWKEIVRTDKGCISGRQEPTMSAVGKLASGVEMESRFGQTVGVTLVLGGKGNDTAVESITMFTETRLAEHG